MLGTRRRSIQKHDFWSIPVHILASASAARGVMPSISADGSNYSFLGCRRYQADIYLRTRTMTEIAYENQLLGAFIYALGFEAGRNQQSAPVNLFQQTPLDSSLGDLIVGGAYCVAIEFKRRRADLRSERTKWRPGFVKWLNERQELLKTSRKSHLVCFGDHGASAVELSFAPYLQVYNDMDSIVGIPASQMLERLATPPLPGKLPAWGVPGSALLSYLEAIRAFRRSDGGRSGVYKATWLTICATSDGYQILAAPSLEALLGHSQEHEHIHARGHERTSEHEQEYDGPSL